LSFYTKPIRVQRRIRKRKRVLNESLRETNLGRLGQIRKRMRVLDEWLRETKIGRLGQLRMRKRVLDEWLRVADESREGGTNKKEKETFGRMAEGD
jgi:5-carboxymethyl-2-hydroxymuconate isomerase